jgi:hypothetical protein
MSEMSSQPRAFNVDTRIGAVVATLGTVPAVLIDAVAERTFDAVDYHQRTVLKYHRLPAGRRAQRFLAARMFRYGRTTPDPKSLAQVRGESFGVEGRGELLEDLESGATINTQRPMAIPFGPPGARKSRVFYGPLSVGRFDIAGQRGLIVERKAAGRRGGASIGERSELVGRLVRRRRQRPLLGFYAAWDRNLPRVTAAFDRDLELVLNEAGRNRLAENILLGRQQRAAARAFLALAPKDRPGARRTGGQVRKAVRADGLARAAGGSA